MATILSRTCFLLALGTSFAIAPALPNFEGKFYYGQAQAAKGGNGNGKSGNTSKGNSASGSKSTKAASSNKVNSATAPDARAKQKLNAKQMALADPTAPAHPSQLGRWNAAKPITHPAIQAHIRNGNFKGTIGMVAGYAVAQTNYNDLAGDLAAAQAVIDAATAANTLALALEAAGYADVGAYDSAVALSPPIAAIDQAKLDLGGQSVPTTEQIAAANSALKQGEVALADLAAAEANMEAYSNRAPWSEIRDDVRARMGLDPAENDLAASTVVDQVVAQ